MRGMTKTFPGVAALESVDLSVAAGTVHALCGENGAGKSTLMNVLAGLVQPTPARSGSTARPVRFATPSEAMGAGIAMIQQELHPVPARSVMENIWLGRFPATGSGSWDTPGCAATPAALFRTSASSSTPTPTASLSGIPGPADGDRACRVPRRAHRDHGRADVVALGRRGRSRCSDHRRLRAAASRIIYISHRLEEVYGDLPTGSRSCATAAASGTGSTATLPSTGSSRMMVGRELTRRAIRARPPAPAEVLLEAA